MCDSDHLGYWQNHQQQHSLDVMQYRDFSLHPLAKRYELTDILMIGWIDARPGFRTGAVPSRFQNKLNQLLEFPITLPGSSYSCGQCRGSTVRSLCEYWIRDASSRIYVVPGLIHHAINSHHYLPPPSFVTCVMNIGALFRKTVIMDQDAVNKLLKLGRATARA